MDIRLLQRSQLALPERSFERPTSLPVIKSPQKRWEGLLGIIHIWLEQSEVKSNSQLLGHCLPSQTPIQFPLTAQYKQNTDRCTRFYDMCTQSGSAAPTKLHAHEVMQCSVLGCTYTVR